MKIYSLSLFKFAVLLLAAQFLFTDAKAADELTVNGTLQQTVESGGWVINTKDGKFLILNSAKFEKEKWFKAGAAVVAKGVKKTDTMTIFMEGTNFEASSMKPAEKKD